jgi:hypothetical protein
LRPASALSCAFAWSTCLYLRHRNGPRDAWYAKYLFTFTLTQLVDIALWVMHENHIDGGLKACVDFQTQFGSAPEGAQLPNFLISKFIIPMIVLSQHWVQCQYPSDMMPERTNLKRLHLIPVTVMSFAFACTRLTQSNFPVAKDTLFWGGNFEMFPFGASAEDGARSIFWVVQIGAMLHSGLVAYVFTLVMPSRVCKAHLGVLACVVGTLLVTEGRMDFGSKWCSYCLIFSFVYLADPLWMSDSGSVQKKSA